MDTIAALRALEPLTADGVAAFLLRRGVTGRPKHPSACPIASYLYAESGHVAHSVTGAGVLWELDAGPEYVLLPPGVRQFVRRFDQGDYPFLESA